MKIVDCLAVEICGSVSLNAINSMINIYIIILLYSLSVFRYGEC